ncbi:MAG TPA: heparan-alpha-glucosaminide N-acetyltransferase domain-containing protein [Candidatus Deferrimicrobiaceae bacterium]|nr:heparan-alpha-glucosaminide N-acetyltransferase domain-containing protein [Candidatus Deferrimicrobiaceae bacterium]
MSSLTEIALAETAVGGVATKRVRIEAIDVVRGVIMILMALDHVRDFFGNSGLNPTDPATTTVPLFFTRWITHFCAPVFFLLTGTGAYLSLRKKSKRELSRFLFTRGLWLIFLELTVTRCLGWQFNFDYHVTLLLVLWALGWSMIVLSALVYLPAFAVTAFGVVMIATHNLLDSVDSSNPLWSILHSPNFILNRPGRIVFVTYALVPWIGVTAAGYGLGQIYRWPSERRKPFLLRLGIGLTAAFLVLRGINYYGNPVPWSTQKSAIYTALSFLNTTKYPPSLLYLLMTLGPALLFLGAVDGRTPQWLRPALIVGKVPMFYYLLHIPLIHLIAVTVCYVRYGQVHWMFESPGLAQFPITPPPGWGYSLPIVYLIWFVVVLTLYPMCRWFAGLKQRRSDAWLSYF